MIKKVLCLMAFLLLSIGIWSAKAQSTVSVTNKTNGATTNYTVQSTGSISFSGDYLVIKESSTASPQSIPLSSIRKMTFSNGSASIDDINHTKSPQLYPNPAKDYCTLISNGSETNHVTIFSITGAKMMETDIENEGRIDISSLKTGVYLVKVNNMTTKLIKW